MIVINLPAKSPTVYYVRNFVKRTLSLNACIYSKACIHFEILIRLLHMLTAFGSPEKETSSEVVNEVICSPWHERVCVYVWLRYNIVKSTNPPSHIFILTHINHCYNPPVIILTKCKWPIIYMQWLLIFSFSHFFYDIKFRTATAPHLCILYSVQKQLYFTNKTERMMY